MKADQDKFLAAVGSCRLMLMKLAGLYAEDQFAQEDLAQEILLQAWKAWPNFRGEAKFSNWFYRICLNTILTHRRNQHTKPSTYPLEGLTLPGATTDDQERETLFWAIRQLGETDRAMITMHLEGYDNTDMAAVFGISNNHVAVKILRIKRQLTKLIQYEQQRIHR